MSMSKKSIAILTITLAVLVDQTAKIYTKTTLFLGQEITVFKWFRIHFVENNGMALGFEFGGETGKLFLTIFRLVAVAGIVYWLVISIKKNLSNIVIFSTALILAGALGNIIDSVFYGAIFDTPNTHEVATLFSDNPYGALFYGKVVDMLYFPVFEGVLPQWIPFLGGSYFTFFQYIFNPADAWITTGVVLLFIFGKQAFPKEEKIKSN